ncbi:MAG: hypothetical protein D8M52_06185 [Chlorobi bacterium]|nr:hypothetical protein [Chlorobiota bacterium]MBV6463890.1 hypothetical protein [Chlorobiota bacterium]
MAKSLSTVTIILSHKVDESSVLQHSRAYGYDTTMMNHLLDSLNIEYVDTMPCMYVLSTDEYNHISDDISAIRRLSLHGHSTIVDDTTLTFTIDPDQLRFNTEYKVIVDDARVLVWDSEAGEYDTVAITQSVTSFTTELAPHTIVDVDYGFSNGLVRCGDTVKITYNRKIPALSNGSGDLIYLLRQGTVTTIDSAICSISYDTVEITPSISADSLTVYIPTDSIIDGEGYFIQSNHRIFTGTDGDTAQYFVRHYGHGALFVTLQGPDSTVFRPETYKYASGQVARTVMPGDTIQVSVPKFIDHLYFSHWLCPSDPSIEAITTPSFSKVYTCSTIVRLDVRAVYRQVKKDTIELTVSGSSWGSISVAGYADSLGSGKYTVWCQPNESLLLTASADSPHAFGAWTVPSIPLINGSTNPVIRYVPIGRYDGPNYNVSIGGGFIPTPTPTVCPPYTIELNVDGYAHNAHEPRVPVQPVTVSTGVGVAIVPVGPYHAVGTYNSMMPIVDFLVGVNVTNTCYEIKTVRENGVLIAGTDDPDGPPVGATWSKLVSVTGDPCIKRFYVTLRHKTYKLTLEIEGLDGTKIDWSSIDILRNGQGKEYRRPSGKIGWKGTAVQNEFDFWDNIVEYACNEVVTLTPVIDKSGKRNAGKAIVGWSNDPGYTYGAVIDAPKKIIRFTMDEDRIVKLLIDEDGFYAIKLWIKTRDPNDSTPLGGASLYSFDIDEKGNISDEQNLAKALIEFEQSGYNLTVYPIVEFNKPVKLSTADASNSGQGLRAYDQIRNDYNDTRHYYILMNDTPRKIKIQCRASDGMNAWCSGQLSVYWDEVIRSTSDALLLNPSHTTVEIAPPTVSVRVDKIEVLKDNDWDAFWWLFGANDPDVLVIAITSMNSESKHGVNFSDAVEPDTLGEYSGMGEGDPQYPSKLISKAGGYSPLANNGYLFLHFIVLDIDYSYDNLASYFGKVADTLATQVKIDSADDYKGYITYALGAVSAFYADLLTNAGEPDVMGQLTPKNEITYYRNIFTGVKPRDKKSGEKENFDPFKSLQHIIENNNIRITYSVLLEPR